MKINQLGKSTNEEKEILNILSEECAEVIQCISKIHRFGWDSENPTKPGYNNKDHLTEELGDLLCMIDIISAKANINQSTLHQHIVNKVGKLRKYSDITFKD
jgi:NTP pyrophosphatase (non-canonical NTP hydrolase)